MTYMSTMIIIENLNNSRRFFGNVSVSDYEVYTLT